MRILIIGGTRFVGRHITEAALAAGHEVSLLHRGRTGADLFPEAEHLTADRNADLSLLRDRTWDATIDVSAYLPAQVDSLADALSTGRYVLISSTAVYTPPPTPGFTEDSPLAEFDGPVPTEVTVETYGALKVLCERAAAARFGENALVVRPTYVVGPHDHTGRFTYWVNRIAEGGEVLAPGDPTDPIQVIDARDMASWIIGLLDRPAGPAVFHAVSPAPPYSFKDMLEAILAEVGPPGTTLTWVGADFLFAEGEDGTSLPLWSEGDRWMTVNTADPAAARATGLDPRPLSRTVREIRASEAGFSTESTITRERENELLTRWHSR
ncbi:NAD-dependent epimerase/dehydratase family protein [Streptosporangium saharense]|uniref:NAD-dependent epimerase/dehydratase family protein n=1 Tax=Streptosporangium saharense TaxID=1706840 RepID=UPI0036BC2034